MDFQPIKPSEEQNNVTPSSQGMPPWVIYSISILGVLYMINPTMGVIEILPDNLPLIGNLDEGGATLAIWYGWRQYFGQNL